MELHPVAIPRQRHIGRMAVHAGGGEDMRPIDRHALRFIDGGGIAMIDMGIIFQVERDRSPVIEPRSEEHTSELQSLMRNSYSVFCLKKKKYVIKSITNSEHTTYKYTNTKHK